MWTDQEIIGACDGIKTGPGFAASSVVIDTRRVTPGALFVALKGTRVDGHDYLADAHARGAVAAVVMRIPASSPSGLTLIQVKDTQKALLDLAVAARKRALATVIGVTGSVGKTGVKEALRAVAGQFGGGHATDGNLNNHIGLPLSVANLPKETPLAVLEMGMNHAGEISFLTRLARPHIAIITTVEPVHLEFFVNVEGIADAKAEIMEGLCGPSVIVLNRDNRYFERLCGHAQRLQVKKIVSFGVHPESDVRLTDYRVHDLHSEVAVQVGSKKIAYTLATIGQHYALNSLAVLAALGAAGLDVEACASALRTFQEPEGRGRIKRLRIPQGNIVVIDDCYNASPVAVVAALAKLTELHESVAGRGRKIALLGDMLELGMAASDMHTQLREPLLRCGVDGVVAVGPLMQHLYASLPASMQLASGNSVQELTATVPELIRADDIILIKGSHGIRMDVLRDTLLSLSKSSMLSEKTDAL